MKQRITLLLAVAALFVFLPQHSTAQNLYKYGFDTTTSSGLPARGWTNAISSPVACCAAGVSSGSYYAWLFGAAPGTYSLSSIQYTTGPTGTYGDWYPNPPTHSGTGMAMINNAYEEGIGYYGYGSTSELRSPGVSLPSSGKSVVSYWVFLDYSYEGGYYGGGSIWMNDSMQVWVNTTASAGGTELHRVRIDSSSTITAGWYQFADTIPSSYNGSTVYIIFKAFTNYYYLGSDINLDDFSVDHYYQCAGVPHCGTPSGPTHICRTKNFSVTDTGGTSYVGMSYQWQSRPNGTTAWSNITGGTTNPLVTNIPLGGPNTDYRVYMTCIASGFTDTSAVWTVTADSFFRCYCAVPTTSTVIGGNTPPTVDSVGISGTTLKNATHTAFSNAYGQIADTVNQTRAVMSRGGSYTLYVRYSGSTAYGMAWIDWNRSGAFNDSGGEYILLNSSLQGFAAIRVTVPVTARTGRTGLRIRTSTAYSPSAGYSCQNFGTGTGAGETADYIVTITDPPTVDLGVTAVVAPPFGASYCPNRPDTITATVSNFGNTAQSNFYVYAVATGAVTDTISTLYSGTLPSLASTNIYIGTIDPPLGGSYSLTLFTKTVGDAVPANDTLFSYINLYNLPANPSVHSDTVCPGGTAHISIAPTALQQYRWYSTPSGGTPFDSTSLVRSVVAPVADSIYYISAKDSGTHCEGNRVPVTAATRPAPIVILGHDTTLCQSPTFFLDAGNPGAKYLWNTGDTVRKINPVTSGTYSVTVNHYCTASSSINLTINPLPVATGIDYIRTGNTYSYELSGTLYTLKYKWYFGDGDTDSVAAPMHTYASGGPWNVRAVLYNNCGTDTISWGVPNKVRNIGQQNGVVNVYPNPANNILTVAGGDNTTLTEVVVVNAVGSVIYRKETNNEKQLNIDVSNIPQGEYILRINTNMGISSKLFDVLHR